MLNLSHLMTSRQTFEVTLTRKPTPNEGQNIRRRIEYVKAHDKAEARRIALYMPHNAGGEATGAALCDRSPRP